MFTIESLKKLSVIGYLNFDLHQITYQKFSFHLELTENLGNVILHVMDSGSIMRVYSYVKNNTNSILLHTKVQVVSE